MGPGRRNENPRRQNQREGKNERQLTTRQKPQKERRKKQTIKIGFWNGTGLQNKDRQFCEFIEQLDIIGLTETQTKDKHWEKLKRNLSEKINWECQYALREKNKGRTSGGIITEIKKWMNEKKTVQETNNVQERTIIIQKRI